MSEKLIEISVKEYEELLDDSIKLEYLESYGVDNWQGYDEAMREFYASRKKDEQK